MRTLTVKLTTTELELLAALAADQLFRKEFIDSRIPGHVSSAADISMGKALVSRFRLLLDPNAAKRMPQARMAG
jgi:hypothetical protein